MGLQAPQEAPPIYRPLDRLAPQQRLDRRRKRRCQGSCLFGFHQGDRREVSLERMYGLMVTTRSLIQWDLAWCFIFGRPQPSAWGEKLPFNTVCGEFNSPNGGWVHDVAFSPSGDALAFASE